MEFVFIHRIMRTDQYDALPSVGRLAERQGVRAALVPLVVHLAARHSGRFRCADLANFFERNGTLNGWLEAWGMEPVDWMDSESAMFIVILIYIWKNVGYNMLLFLAGLQNIPEHLYEAARIDGAGRWGQWRSITIVYLTPTTFFVFVMSIINSFKVFRETYMLAGPYPHQSLYMLQHFMNNMFQQLDYQKMTSAAFLMASTIVLMVLVLFTVERRFNRWL